MCSHVLEHVPDPVRFLSIVARKLSAAGQIDIEVPGIENPSVIENNLGVQPTHLTYFTRKTLIACCEKAHLDVVRINDKIQAVAIPRDRALPSDSKVDFEVQVQTSIKTSKNTSESRKHSPDNCFLCYR